MTIQIKAEPIPLRVDENGAVRVGKTRVLLEVVITAYNMGATAEEIVWQFPTLELGDVHAVLGYYLHHRDEVNEYMAQVQRDADEIRKEFEAKFGKQPSREELLARRTKHNMD